MARRYIGYGTTNAQGVATLDYDANGDAITGSGYTGSGVGEIDFQAELHDDSTVVSGTYPVLDCITTTNDESIWENKTANITKTNVTNGVNFKVSGGTAKTQINLSDTRLILPLEHDWCIEFDIMSNLLSFYFTQSAENDGSIFIAYHNSGQNSIANLDNTVQNHLKFVYSSINHTINVYVNDSTTSGRQIDVSSFTNDIGFKLIDWNGDMDCTLTNLKIYLQ